MKQYFQFTKHQFVILGTCVAIFALGQFHRASGGVFTPILMESFAVSAATIGALVSAMFFATIIVQLPFGILLDKIGPRFILTGCILIIALGTGLFAANFSFTSAVISRVLIGIGLASMGAATHVIIARNFKGSDFGYVSGLVVTLGGIGGLLGTYPLAVALQKFTWASVFFPVTLITSLLAVAVFFLVKSGSEQTDKDKSNAQQGGYLSLLADSEFRKILALGIVTFAPITTITGLWGGPYLQDVIGLSAEHAGAVLLLLFASTIVAGYTFGVLDKRLNSRLKLSVGAAFASGVCLITLSTLQSPGGLVAITLLTAMVFLQQFYIPLGAHMRNYVSDDQLGRASTLLSVVSVAAIPAFQIGFGLVMDLARESGVSTTDQYRVAFAFMGILIIAGGLIYTTAKNANNA